MSVHIEYVPLPQVMRWDRNPKEHDLPKLIKSIQDFGFVTPLVKDEGTGKLVEGHGRLEALQRMRADGHERPKGIEESADGLWTVPVLCGLTFANADEAEAYLLASNRLVELGGWNDDFLAEMLRDLEGSGMLDMTAFSSDDLEGLLADNPLVIEPEAPVEGHSNEDTERTEHREGVATEREGRAMREVVLLMEADDHAAFLENVDALRLEYGTETLAATIIEVVARAVRA